MRPNLKNLFRPMIGVALLLIATVALYGEPQDTAKKNVNESQKVTAVQQPAKAKRITVTEARERAKLMHNIYIATLDVIHRRYFQKSNSLVPSRALDEVFAKIDSQENIQARWIAVNARAMSIGHKPRDDFEKQAARAIVDRKGEYEQIKNGLYRRAGAIPLGGGCLGCHGTPEMDPTARGFAGLVITIPVDE